jgi:MATE family multidrug resistance protein
MLILDQLILANYSIDAMAGASAASVWCGMLQFATMSITTVVGALVGNYNGAKKFELAGTPVWQMIWFSVSLFSISIPFSMLLAKFCIPKILWNEGIPYFKVLMFSAPLSGIYYVLSSFFVAIGKGILVTISILVANIVNVTLDIILVFGYFGIEKFKGSLGAATGTVIALLVEIIILFSYFFSKKIREKYGTLNFKLRFEKLKECLKLGASGGIGHVCEMSAWSFVYYNLASISKDLALIQSIAVSVNIFLAFIVSGLEKGMMSMTANLLGAGKKDRIRTLIKKGVCIHIMFVVIAAPIFIFYPELIIKNFIKFDINERVMCEIVVMLRVVLLFFIVDGLVWVIAGVIEGGGDISYVMLTIAVCIWCIVVIPSFALSKFGIQLGLFHVEITWILLSFAAASEALLLYRRYRSDKWIHIKV